MSSQDLSTPENIIQSAQVPSETHQVPVQGSAENTTAGGLVSINNDREEETRRARDFLENLMAKREELTYKIGQLIVNTIMLLEERLWSLWADGNVVSTLENLVRDDDFSWRDELDRELVSKIHKLRRAKREVLGRQEIAIVLGTMLENHFNSIYDRITRNEPIPELQPLHRLANYSAYTFLYIWAHQTANVHLAVNRMELKTNNWDAYRRVLGTQLNSLLNKRFRKIEEEICTVVTNWTVNTLQGQKPFCFNVTLERE